MSHIYAAEGMFRSLTALVGIATVDPSQLPSCVSRESIASFLEMAHPESDFRPGTPEDKLRQHILEGNEAAALVLLEDSCIRLSAEDKAGRTLLHHSAGANLLELTNALIDFGANPLAQTVAGETPLLYTMLLNGEEPEYDKSGMVLLRRDHGLTPQMASLLLRRCPQLGQIADNRNLLPSAHAAAMGDVDLLDTLKSAGVDLALAGLTGMTAHYAAACELKEDAVTYLLRNGVLPAQPAAIAGSVMRPYEVASNVARQSGQATIIPNLLFVGDINMQALQMEGRSAEQVDLLEAIAAPDTYRKILVEANANGNQSRTRVAADILSQALKLPELEPGSSESIVRRQLFDAHGIPAGMEFGES